MLLRIAGSMWSYVFGVDIHDIVCWGLGEISKLTDDLKIEEGIP